MAWEESNEFSTFKNSKPRQDEARGRIQHDHRPSWRRFHGWSWRRRDSRDLWREFEPSGTPSRKRHSIGVQGLSSSMVGCTTVTRYHQDSFAWYTKLYDTQACLLKTSPNGQKEFFTRFCTPRRRFTLLSETPLVWDCKFFFTAFYFTLTLC